MKLELPLVKSQTRKKLTSKLLPLIALTILVTIPLFYFPFFKYSSSKNKLPGTTSHAYDVESSSTKSHVLASPYDARKNNEIITSSRNVNEQCDLFSGEWVSNPEGPYYTNETCFAIQEHQNCMRFGRPDTDYLKWRWKPDDCELPIFDPFTFLKMMKGKSLAFVGDSLARNHMQSLICLLSRISYPVDLSDPENENKRYIYKDYNFNISIFWSPYLVKTGQLDPNSNRNPFNLYLDQPDPYWPTQIRTFDYVLISAGHWFFRPTYFYLNNSLVGCLYCPDQNVTRLPPSFSYRRAFRTALTSINDISDFDGITFLRTFAPSHFEGGGWDSGGNCLRTRPLKSNETGRVFSEMYTIQMEELRIAQKGAIGKNKIKLFDATKAMVLRPDGHPSRFGHWPEESRVMPNDCVHWCLPGPIDALNDLLQELLRRENIYLDDSH